MSYRQLARMAPTTRSEQGLFVIDIRIHLAKDRHYCCACLRLCNCSPLWKFWRFRFQSQSHRRDFPLFLPRQPCSDSPFAPILLLLRCAISFIVIELAKNQQAKYLTRENLTRTDYNSIAASGSCWSASRRRLANRLARPSSARSAVIRANSGRLLLSERCARTM